MSEENVVKSPRVRRAVANPKENAAAMSDVPVCRPRVLRPWGVAITAIIVLAIAVFSVVSTPGATPVQRYSAVFLTNGQVYFGRIAQLTPSTLVLHDVHYLQTTPSLQQGDADGATAAPDIALVKLGSELHGPTDEMQISRAHILFTETLRDDGTVSQAIAARASASTAPVTPTSGGDVPASGDVVE